MIRFESAAIREGSDTATDDWERKAREMDPLIYAQDRKAADSRYSVAAFRRDIVIARINRGIADTMEMREAEVELPELKPSWAGSSDPRQS